MPVVGEIDIIVLAGGKEICHATVQREHLHPYGTGVG